MGEDGFDWHGGDRADDAGERSTAERDGRREDDPTPEEEPDAGRSRGAGDPDVASLDDDDASSADEVADSSVPAEGDSGGSNPFSGLVDRIAARADRTDDVGDLRDLVPPDAIEDDPAVEHLLDRAEADSDRRSSDESPSESPDRGERGAPPDVDPVPDEGLEPAGASTTPGDRTPELPDGEEGDGVGRDRSSRPDRSNPFDDLADRVASDADRRSSRDRFGTGGSVDHAGIPSDATNVLLLSPLDTDAAFDLCLSLIRERPPDRTNLLFVWLTRDAGDRLARLYESYADPSTSVTVICRSEIEHLLRANPSIPTGDPGSNLSIKRISDPRDLPKLGIAINRAISDWSGPKRPLMCFHSVTDLLQFEDHERVFRFLHVLGGRMNSVGARAYYHLDPDAHDQQTVAMFRNLFDATVDLAGAGTDDE